MPRQLRVFLCHASQDKPAVRELYKRLKAEDWIDPWLDEEKLSFGQHWTTVIEDALSESDIVIIFLSQNSVRKEGFIQRELNYAWELSLEKPRNDIFLIPFRLDDCQIPRYLGSRQWGDYFDDKKENTYQILLRSLKQRHQQKLKLEEEERVSGGREAAEKAVLERQEEARNKAELEFIEKAKLKAAKKKTEWEAAERISRERAEREKIELAQAKQAEKEKFEKQKLKPMLYPAHMGEKKPESAPKSAPKLNLRTLGIGGIVCVGLLIAIFGGNYLFKNINPLATEPTSIFTAIPPTFAPYPGIGLTQVSKKDGMTLVFVPAGEFNMGSDSESDAQPTHQVDLSAFWIDQTEVTNAMYAKCAVDGGCTPPLATNSNTHNSYYDNSEFDDFPVIYVNWSQASAYCSWSNRRLATEAEWEKAARGTDGRTYPWGEGIDCHKANYFFNKCIGDTTKVGSYLEGVSPYDVYDMAGNVWEWVNDWYDGNYYRASPMSNPQGPTLGEYRVLRGGSWNDFNNAIPSANRNSSNPSSASSDIGFRCALSP